MVFASLVLGTMMQLATADPAALAPESGPVWVIERVTVTRGQEAAALAYYRSAWFPARIEAKKRKLIDDYRFLERTEPDGTHKLVLMTRYPNERIRLGAQPTWQIILKNVAPNGATLPTGLTAADIRTNTGMETAVERDLAE